MPSHYIKIPPTIKPWVPGDGRDDWRESIFADITENGSRISVASMPANDRGVRVAIYGDVFYVEVGRDRDRADTLFLMRIERAGGVRLPKAIPTPITHRFILWPGGDPPVLDSVGSIFGIDEERTVTEEPEDAPASEAIPPTPLLLSRLANTQAAVRTIYRPAVEPPIWPEATALIDQLRRAWRQLRAERYMRLTAREESILRGVISPQRLELSERQSLIDLFGMSLLNSMALDMAVDLSSVLETLAALPLPLSTRATIWAASLAGASPQALRRELHDAAPGLRTLAAQQSSAATWQEAASVHLVETARAAGDESLLAVLQGTHEEANLAASLAAWAERLEFPDETSTAMPSLGPSIIEGDVVTTTEAVELAVASTGAALGVGVEVSGEAVVAPIIDNWVMNLHAPDVESLATVADRLNQLATIASRLLQTTTSPSALAGAIEEVASTLGELQEVISVLPDPNRLRNDQREATAAREAAINAIGPDADRLLTAASSLTPSQLVDIAALVSRSDVLGRIPEWIWLTEEEEVRGTGSLTPLLVAQRLLHPEVRQRVRRIVEYADQLAEPAALDWLGPPPPERSIDDHLREWFEQVRDFLLLVPSEVRSSLRIGSDTGLADIRQEATQLSHLQRCVSDHVYLQILEELKLDPNQRGMVLSEFCEAVDFFRSNFGQAQYATFEALKSRVQTLRDRKPTEKVTRPSVAVEHNWMDAKGSKATLVLARPTGGQDYGTLAVPLVLVADRPRQIDVAVEWEVRGDLRAGWPKEWPNPEPAGVIRIPVYAWRPQPDKDTYHYTLQATFPVYAARLERRPRLEVTATVRDAESGQRISDPTPLFWESIHVQQLPITVQWSDQTAPEYVKEHPVGPQEGAERILARFQAGSSVAVVAPRRFGKSTLVEYLVTAAQDRKLCVPPPVICTRHVSGGGIDPERLWGWISDRLQDALGSGLPRDWRGPLPPEHAFDDARRRAKELGFTAIVLLFDEAQLFFPPQTGRQIGSQLKTLLERSWSRRDHDKRVPVLFGMIGLPSLPQRAGADLMGVFKPIERLSMEETELRPLISKITTGLQTTRGARERLAETSGNLLILRALLEKLALRVTREQRAWINYDDVLAVEEALEQDLQAGRETTVASYIRDVLNGADSVDEWRPVPSFPVAVALADCRQPGHPLTEAIGRAAHILNRWCEASHPSENVRAMYTEAVVGSHLQQLLERRVVTDVGFTSGLLDAWLVGIARRNAFDESFRDALFRGAQRRIQVPAGAELVATGGQASVLKFDRFAYRVRVLSNRDEHQRFLESLDTLEVLKEVVSRRETGSDHIFEIQDMGLSTRDEREAIQVYRWVSGQDLAAREHSCSADVVIELGVKLGRALRLLHRHNILHRDICPRNIVLDVETEPESMRPVLIDFGFARLATAPMNTRMAGEHFAPEVCTSLPQWSRAADVYGLCSTLEWLLDSADATGAELLSVLQAGTSSKPGERPTAEDLVSSFDKLEESRRLEERRNEIWWEFYNGVGQDRHLPWFSAVLHRYRSTLVGLAMGSHRNWLERVSVLAEFLNQIVEAYPKDRRPLRGIRTDAPIHGLDVVATLSALRANRVHAREAHNDETRASLSSFQALSKHQQEQVLEAGIRSVARHCQLTALEPALQRLT